MKRKHFIIALMAMLSCFAFTAKAQTSVSSLDALKAALASTTNILVDGEIVVDEAIAVPAGTTVGGDGTLLSMNTCATKYNKPVIVMEPVKGGTLVKLPDDAKKVFDELGDLSYASYAIRFAASFEGVVMVLSGMSNIKQMEDNISFMKDFKPLDSKEMQAVEEVTRIITSKNIINCT